MSTKTKTIVIGDPISKTQKIPIEFCFYLENTFDSPPLYLKASKEEFSPRDFKFIELICLNYSNNVDLMFAYDIPTNRRNGVLFIGKWNDGVAEWDK